MRHCQGVTAAIKMRRHVSQPDLSCMQEPCEGSITVRAAYQQPWQGPATAALSVLWSMLAVCQHSSACVPAAAAWLWSSKCPHLDELGELMSTNRFCSTLKGLRRKMSLPLLVTAAHCSGKTKE